MPLEDDDYSAFGDPVEAEADDYSAFGDPIETTPPPPAVAPARRLGDRGGPSLRRPVPGADHPLMRAGRDPLTGQNIKPITKEVGGTQYIKRGADVLNADTGETTADPAVLEAFGRSTPGKRTVGDVRTEEALGERVDGATTIRHKDGTTIKPPEGMTRYRAPGEPPPAPKDQARLEEEGGTGYFSEFARAATKGVIDTVATTLKGAAGLTTDDPRKVAQVMTDLARVGEMDEPTFQRFFQEIPLYAQINPIAAFDYRRAAQAYRRGDKAKGDAFLAQAQGNTNIGEVEKSQLFQAGEKLSGLASQPEFQPQGGFTPESITVQLGQGAGSMLALLPAGIFGRLPGVTAASVSAGAGEAMENAQREIGTSRRDDRAGLYNAGLGEEARSKVLQASRLGVAPGATDIVPIEVLLERLPAMIPGLRQHARSGLWSRVSKAIGQTATQAGIEGGQEGAQQYLQNVITQLTLNPEKELTEDVLHSIAIGGAVGGMVQAPVSVVDALRPGQPKGAVTPPPPGAPGQTPPGMSGPAPEGPASPGGGAESGGKSPGGTSTTPKAGEGPQPLDSARIADLLQTAGYTDQELADLRARGELGAIVDIVRKTGIVPPKGYKPKPATPSSSRTTVTVDGKTTVTETGTRPRDEMDYDPGDGTGAEEISTEGEAIDAPRPQSQGERGGREAPQDELRADARDVLGPSDGLSQEADAGRTAGSAREDFSAEGESLGDGTKARPIKVASEADIAAVRDQANPEPTDGQKDALNYRAAHVKLHGLDIAIETPKGGVRRSRKDAPVQWETTMPADYGRIKGTTNSDGEEMDVTIGPNPRSSKAVIIDQRDPETGEHDEYKVILGTDTTEEATDLYEASFSDGSGPKRIAGVEEMDVSQLKDWLANPPKPKSVSAKPKSVTEIGLPDEYSLAEDADGRQTFESAEDATPEHFRALAKKMAAQGFEVDKSAIRTLRNPKTGEIIEVEPGGADTSGHFLHRMKGEPATEVNKSLTPPKTEVKRTPVEWGAQGRADFKAGKNSTPPAELRGDKLGTDAWVKGWHAANVAEPVQGVTDDFTKGLFDTANRGNAAPAVKHENGRNYRVKKDEGGGYIGVRLPPKQIPGKPPSGLLPSYLRPPKGEKWTKEQAVEKLNAAIAQGDKWGLWEKHEEAEAAIKAQEAKKTAAPAGPRVMVNLVGKDGLTDAERGGPLKKADDRPYFDELTIEGRRQVFARAGKSPKEAVRLSKMNWHYYTLEQQGLFAGAVKPLEAPAPLGKDEHPGLVIKSLQTGKETVIQPEGTVPPRKPTEAETEARIAAGKNRETMVRAATGKEKTFGKFKAVITQHAPFNSVHAFGDTKEEAIEKAEGRLKAFPPREKWKQIGVNKRGNPVFEDERGVRSYTESGVRVSESVQIVPGKGISVDTSKRGSDYTPVEKETQPAETTAEKPGAETFDDSAGTAAIDAVGGVKPEPPADGDENPADYETSPEISEEGPWDFNELYPAPDLDAIARLDADGRTVFEDPDDAVEVSSVIEETMNELTMLHGDLRELRRLADLAAKGNLTGKNKKLKPATIAAEKAKTKETLANMLGELETVFGPEAAKAIDAEAKNRSKTNDQRAEGMAEDYGPTRLKDREPPAPLIKAADYSEAGEPVPKQPLSETKIVVTVDTETEQGVETAMSADWAIGLADKRLKALYKVLDCLNG